MGYEINSPVKQVWLPLDYGFLSEHTPNTFGEFSKEYQKKYGIDLHDIFRLYKVADEFAVGSKVDLVGTYAIGKLNDVFESKIALTNGLAGMTSALQDEEVRTTILRVEIGFGIDVAHGFTFVLPSLSEREVETIDDLDIGMYEI